MKVKYQLRAQRIENKDELIGQKIEEKNRA